MQSPDHPARLRVASRRPSSASTEQPGACVPRSARHQAGRKPLAARPIQLGAHTKWVADLTRILTTEGVLWLASMRDAVSHKVIGRDSGRASTELLGSALD